MEQLITYQQHGTIKPLNMKVVKNKQETITVDFTQEEVAGILYDAAKKASNYSSSTKFEGEQISYTKEVAKKNSNKQHTVGARVVLTNPIVDAPKG